VLTWLSTDLQEVSIRSWIQYILKCYMTTTDVCT